MNLYCFPPFSLQHFARVGHLPSALRILSVAHARYREFQALDTGVCYYHVPYLKTGRDDQVLTRHLQNPPVLIVHGALEAQVQLIQVLNATTMRSIDFLTVLLVQSTTLVQILVFSS
jgi:hypothetical protein